MGRFLSADTIVPSPGNPQSLNRFSYVRNNPLKFIDPTGHGEDCGPTGHDKCESDPPPPPPPLSDLFFVCKQEKPRVDETDLFLDKMTLGLDTIASGGSAFGAGLEIGGCLFGPEGCGTGFAMYNAGLNQFESMLSRFSKVPFTF